MTVREKACKRCGKTKPLKDFKRTLTLAQSRALLKRPTLRTPHETVSTLCKACRPIKLTAKKIQNLVFNGDINAVTGDYLKTKLVKDLKDRQSKGMQKVWHKRKQEKVDAHITPWYLSIRQQVAKKYNYYTLQKSKPKHPSLTDYAEQDYEIAKRYKNALGLQVKLGEGFKMDLYPSVNDYYNADEKLHLYNLWTQIPQDIRTKLRRAK